MQTIAIYSKCGSCGNKLIQGTKCECRKDRYKRYDKEVRNSQDNTKYTEFYNSPEWDKLSSYIKRRYKGLCLMCLFEHDEITTCDITHHITPIRVDFSKRFDEKELIPLCHRCHNSIDHKNYTEEMKNKLRELLAKFQKTYGKTPRGQEKVLASYRNTLCALSVENYSQNENSRSEKKGR